MHARTGDRGVGGIRTALLSALVALAALAAGPTTAPAGSITALPTTNAYWSAVSDTGVVVGGVGPAPFRAARWAEGSVTPFGTSGTFAEAIDSNGRVFGNRYGETAAEARLAWWSAAGTEHLLPVAALGENTGFQSASPSGEYAIGFDGTSVIVAQAPAYHPVAGPAECGHLFVFEITDLGHVLCDGGFYDGAVFRSLDPSFRATAINRSDLIVGFMNSVAMIRSLDGTLHPLPLPAGATNGLPRVILDDGRIAGRMEIDGRKRAAIWADANTPAVLLDSLLPAGSGWETMDITAFTPGGYVLGDGLLNGVYTPFVASVGAAVRGLVRDRYDAPVAGVTITLTGVEDGGGAVTRTATSDDDGNYAIPINPGTYAVTGTGDQLHPDGRRENGGALSPLPADGGACTGTATGNRCDLVPLGDGQSARVDFTYTPCAVPERRHDGQPLTSCPIIFVPGFLGSRIVCEGPTGATQELWPNIPGEPGWGAMLLQPDGETNVGNRGPCTRSAHAAAGKDGLVATVAGQSIYQTTMAFLDLQVGARRWWAFPYDWRKSPVLAVPALDALVDDVLEETHASRVVLYGHSMGGLVLREYVSSAARADKVVRLATAGTPYWGAPKSHFSFLEGDTDTPERGALDLLTTAADLQKLAQNLQGLFFLHPSARLGPWLSISNGVGPYVPQAEAGEVRWVNALGGNASLLLRAHRWHAQRDGFPETPIDYEVMVGAGSPTVQKIEIRRISGLFDGGRIHYGSGDGTVPLRSATQGASDGITSRAKVGIHYVCDVGHVALPGDPAVTSRLAGFLTRGARVTGVDDNCAFAGTSMRVFGLRFSAGNVQVEVPQATRALAPVRLEIADAVARGIVQVLQLPGQTTFVTSRRNPVTLVLTGKRLGVQVQAISSGGEGAVRSFDAGSGRIAINAAGAVTRNGAPVRASRPRRGKPVTRIVSRKRGSRLVVRLVARAPNGVAATYYRVGRGRTTRYVGPFRLRPKQLRSLVVSSTDRFGAVETPHGVRRR